MLLCIDSVRGGLFKEVSNRTITVKCPGTPLTSGAFFIFMKYKSWDNFLIHCSGIQSILTIPKGIRPLSDKEIATLSTINLKDEKTEKEIGIVAHLTKKMEVAADPPLSKTAISYLTRRYGWEKYAKKTASKGIGIPYREKGNLLEQDAISLLSKLDKISYQKSDSVKTNDFMLGKPDIVVPGSTVIDVKVAWNLQTFLNVLNAPLKSLYWYQMQGYLELYDLPVGYVCFCLMDTPEELIEKERIKLLNKFVIGETNREDYERNNESLDMALTYNNIPLKRRVIRFKVTRSPEIIPMIQKKVVKCRAWLNEFEKNHILGRQIITLRENYVNLQENNTKSDPDESCENN